MAKTNKKGVAAGVLAVAAAGVAAGYYFYASKDAKKNRRIAAQWARDMKKETLRQAKKLGELDRKTLMSAVDKAAAAYETVRSVDRAELARAVRELKTNWQELAREAGAAVARPRTVRKAVRTAKKAAKKAKAAPRTRSR